MRQIVVTWAEPRPARERAAAGAIRQMGEYFERALKDGVVEAHKAYRPIGGPGILIQVILGQPGKLAELLGSAEFGGLLQAGRFTATVDVGLWAGQDEEATDVVGLLEDRVGDIGLA